MKKLYITPTAQWIAITVVIAAVGCPTCVIASKDEHDLGGSAPVDAVGQFDKAADGTPLSVSVSSDDSGVILGVIDDNFIDQTRPSITNHTSHRITVVDGHLSVGGRRFRCVGTNLANDALSPTHLEAKAIATRLARFGYNCVRLHAVDGHIIDNVDWKSPNLKRIDRVDYLISQLAANGIYVIFNFHQSRRYPAEGWLRDRPNAQAFYDTSMQAARNSLESYWLTRTNPYLGAALKDHPVLAMWQIINEESLLNRWSTGQINKVDPAHPELNAMWRAWSGLKRDLPPWGGPDKRRVAEFIGFADKKFLDEQYAYLKTTVGVKCLVFGPQEEYILPGTSYGMDLQDVHAYHDHWHGSPGAENQPLSAQNLPFAKAVGPTLGGPTNLVYRLHQMNPNMARIITEFNWSGLHTTFDEVPLFWALLALQDTDGAFGFLYGTNGPDRGLSRDYIRGNDTRLNPVWMIGMATAGRAFKEARLPPLARAQYSHFTASDVLDLAVDHRAGSSLLNGPIYNWSMRGGSSAGLRAIVSRRVGTIVGALSSIPDHFVSDEKNGWDWNTGHVVLTGDAYRLESSLSAVTVRGVSIPGPVTVQTIGNWRGREGAVGTVITTGGKVTNTGVDWWNAAVVSGTNSSAASPVTITLSKPFGKGIKSTPRTGWTLTLSGTNSTPSLDGTYSVAKRISDTRITIIPGFVVTVGATAGKMTFRPNAWGNSTGAVNNGWGKAPVINLYNPVLPGATPLDNEGGVSAGERYWYAISEGG